MTELADTAVELDIVLRQGSTWEKTITIYDGSVKRDLAGYGAAMHIRATYASSATLLELTSDDGGGITIDETNDNITILITDEQTAALGFETARYDLELIPSNGKTFCLLFGKVTLKLEVTR